MSRKQWGHGFYAGLNEGRRRVDVDRMHDGLLRRLAVVTDPLEGRYHGCMPEGVLAVYELMDGGRGSLRATDIIGLVESVQHHWHHAGTMAVMHAYQREIRIGLGVDKLSWRQRVLALFTGRIEIGKSEMEVLAP